MSPDKPAPQKVSPDKQVPQKAPSDHETAMALTSKRKQEHITLTASGEAAYQKTAGFERYDFQHNALTETAPQQTDLTCSFLGRTFNFPLFISSMTGGHAGTTPVNATIAAFCQQEKLPFGVGSQRAMVEDPSLADTFAVARKEAPDAFIAANIGGAQLAAGLSAAALRAIIDVIRADALIVHLNPLQEACQPEGDRTFRGIRKGLERLVLMLEPMQIPVIVKETGAGISGAAALVLADLGVSVIDVAGAGGTSWSRVENLRSAKTGRHFSDEWGIPTVECLLQLRSAGLTDRVQIIASGGIRSSQHIAKSLCLGAHMAATAQPVIAAVMQQGYQGLERWYRSMQDDMRLILSMLDCVTPDELNMAHLRLVHPS